VQPVDVFLEGWTPAYGSAYAVDEDLDDDPAEVSLEEDGHDMVFHTCQVAELAGLQVAFVDGVRRKEEGLYRRAEDGRIFHALVGAFGVGSVVADASGSLRFGSHVVRRMAIWCGGEVVDLPAARGGYSWESVAIPGVDPVLALRELQNRMRREEGLLAGLLGEAGYTVVVDGPLSHVENRDIPVIGYVKVQHRMHLPLELHLRLPELARYERTSLFRLGERRYSCYMRLEPRQSMTGPWHAIVRLEFPASRGLEAASAAADFAAGLLPRYASRPWRDPRAPQNLAPIGSLEDRLRHLLGNQALVARAVREAVASFATPTRIPA
jgi:uncharacterized protein